MTPIETNVDVPVRVVAFSADGEYLVSGDNQGVRVWKVEDGSFRLITTMAVGVVKCLAISKDGGKIAAGRWLGDVVVWDAYTYKKLAALWDDHVNGADFSPSSGRLVTAPDNHNASVWDVTTGVRVLTLRHKEEVRAAKYSQYGDLIATATDKSVRVFDSGNGAMLVGITAGVTPWYNTGLLWSPKRIYVISNNKIKEIEASNGSLVSEWPVPNSDASSCIALSHREDFIAHSAKRTVTFWDTSTHAQLGQTQHTQDIRSISLSPDDQSVAIGGEGGKITIKSLSLTTVCIMSDSTVYGVPKRHSESYRRYLAHKSTPLRDPNHRVLASRALVRTRLRQWDRAIEDAEQSIKIRPSALAYIIKSMALVGKGNRHKAYRVCDIAFEYFHSSHATSLLLIKAIIVFMAGEYDDAISRIDDLIAAVPSCSTWGVVQARTNAYMYLLLGNSQLESRKYQSAICSLERARVNVRQHTGDLSLMISLIFGWKFDSLGITIQRRLCEALFAAGRTNDAGESLLKIANTLGEDVYKQETMTKWISGFVHRCLSARKSDDDTMTTTPDDSVRGIRGTVESLNHLPLVREWAKATLASSSWQDTLVASVDFQVPRSTIYRGICESLETVGRVTDAIECLKKMENELASENQAIWVDGFKRRCVEELRSLGDEAMIGQRNDDALTLYSTALYLNPASPQDIYVMRSRVYASMGLWKCAVDDVAQVMLRDPSSPWGYDWLLKEWAMVTLANCGSWKNALTAAGCLRIPRFLIYRALCDRLRMVSCVADAVECLRQMESELAEGTTTAMGGEQTKWIADFKQYSADSFRHLGDAAVDADKHDVAIAHYSAALSLKPALPQRLYILRSRSYMAIGLWENAIDDSTHVITLDPSSRWSYDEVLKEWAKAKLTAGLQWKNALNTASSLKVPKFAVYQALCGCLDAFNRIVEATECVHEMEKDLAQTAQVTEVNWALDFKFQCLGKLEALGSAALSTRQYDEAISFYTAALSLCPTSPQTLFIGRSKARSARGMWKDALNDANQAITLDPSSPSGYQRKYVALRGLGCHKEMVDALETMICKMGDSSDPEIREHCHQYAKIKEAIHKAIQDAIRESPRVLINTTSGRLCNKSEQAAAFKLLPAFTDLILSMTTQIDQARIKREVTEYFRYATFSHKWEDNEPSFDKVVQIVVYDLDESPTHNKLQMFCKIAREAGFHWAWSDTCCINKADHFVLQEALVAMFKWYEGSSLTIIFLRGVRSPSRRGDLVRSVWNTRVWTFQEYHASKVVRFYTEDWALYMNLNIPNHKDSPEIISEMEEATGVSAQALMDLRPGLDDIREKLCLASRRETTLIEDEAYSLLGIFSVSLPVVYGEGNKSLGRLLAQLLTSSGDTNILAWTGKSGSFNSCIPATIAVFSQSQATHIPPDVSDAETDMIIGRLRTPSLDFSVAMRLYDQLNDLPVPLFAGRRMKLPCIIFKLGPLSASRSASEYVFRAQTAVLGIVAIKTTENLSRFNSLYLIHPWIDFLLDRQPVGSVSEPMHEETALDHRPSIGGLPPYSSFSQIAQPVPRYQSPVARHVSRQRQSLRGLPTPPPYSEVASLRPPSSITHVDKEMRALRLVSRLRQPFGALLLTPNLGNVAAYRRVAAESLITVQLESITSMILNKLVDSVHVLDVL